MKLFSTGEAAKAVGVTRDSLFGALKNGAPDAENRVGGRRYFTEEEVSKLADWYTQRRRHRAGDFEDVGREGAYDSHA